MRTTIKPHPQAHGGAFRAESVRTYSAATLNSKNVTASNSSGVLHDGRIAPLHPRVPKRHLHILPAPLSHAAATENLTLPKTGRELKHRAEFTAGAPNIPSATRPTTADARHKAKKRLHYRIWLCMTKTQDWNRWQRLFGDFHDLQLPYDEVSYTLLLWGYVLSHRHRSENAYMVLNAMKESDFVHGALLRANEGFLNCFFELGEVQARPQKTMWQNVVRMLVHAAQRFHRRRAKRTKEELLSLPGETLMALQPADVRRELLEDVRLSRIEAGNGARLDELRLGDYAAADQACLHRLWFQLNHSRRYFPRARTVTVCWIADWEQEAGGNKMPGGQQEEQLRRLHAEIEQTTRKLELAKRRTLKLGEDLWKAKREYEALHQTKRPQRRAANKQIQENKVAKALLKADNLNHENMELRRAIELVRRDRLQCNTVLKKVRDALREKEKAIAGLDVSTQDTRQAVQKLTGETAARKSAREKQNREWKAQLRKVQENLRKAQNHYLQHAAASSSSRAGSTGGNGTAQLAQIPSASSTGPVNREGRGGTGAGAAAASTPAGQVSTSGVGGGGSGNTKGGVSPLPAIEDARGGATTANANKKVLTINTGPAEEIVSTSASPASPRKHPLGGYVNCTPMHLPKTPGANSRPGGVTPASGLELASAATAAQPPGKTPRTPRTPGGALMSSGASAQAKTPNSAASGGAAASADGGNLPAARKSNFQAPVRGGRRTVLKEAINFGTFVGKGQSSGDMANAQLAEQQDRGLFSEHRYMRLIFKAAFCNAIQRRHIKQHQNSIQVYEQAFQRIRSSTGISDIEEIVKIFTKLEERNYSLLVYVNLLSREIESLQRKKTSLAKERSEQLDKRRSDEKTRQKMIGNVQAKIDKYRRLVAEHRRKTASAKIPEEANALVRQICATLREQHLNLLMHNKSLLGVAGFGGASEVGGMMSGGLGNVFGPPPAGLLGTGVGAANNLQMMASNRWQPGSGPSSQPNLSGMNTMSAAGVASLLFEEEDAFSTSDPGQEGSTAGGSTNKIPITAYLAAIERVLTQWHEVLPVMPLGGGLHSPAPSTTKPFPYTVAQDVKAALSPKKGLPTLLKITDLPNTGTLHATTQKESDRRAAAKEEDDSDDEEERALSRAELQSKVNSMLAKRKKRFNVNTNVRLTTNRRGSADEDLLSKMAASGSQKPEEDDSGSLSSDSDSSSGFSSSGEEAPSDEQINEIFLKRYKMSKVELVGMAEKMGIALSNLCYLKQEFDMYDEDSSGFIDLDELQNLLQKLGEDLSEEELHQAFKELDQDASGEIEFFEFVEWFTTEE
eukprot:g5904.t1